MTGITDNDDGGDRSLDAEDENLDKEPTALDDAARLIATRVVALPEDARSQFLEKLEDHIDQVLGEGDTEPGESERTLGIERRSEFELHLGPLPSSSMAREYEMMRPESIDDFVEMAREDQRHRAQRQADFVDELRRTHGTNRLNSSILAVVCYLSSLVLA